jgi:glycerophosphoryl diester phosphodiesterase
MLFLVILGTSCAPKQLIKSEVESPLRVKNIAHRGGAGIAPENSLLAFHNSLRVGADVLELDVHTTSDGHIVVIHDSTVDKTTNGSGRVKDFTLSQLKELDAAYNFTTDNGTTYPYRGKGTRIPTLEEIFKEFKDQEINIEIRQFDPPIEKELGELIRRYQMEEKVVVASVNKDSLNRFRKMNPDIRTSLARDEVMEFMFPDLFGYEPPGFALQVPETHKIVPFVTITIVTEDFINKAHRNGLEVHVWTVNDVGDMKRFINMGVDGIMTDYPDRLSQLLKEGK